MVGTFHGFSEDIWPPGTPEGEGCGKGSFQSSGQEVPGIQEPEVRVLAGCPGQRTSERVMAESSGRRGVGTCLGLSSETMPQMGEASRSPRHWAAKKAQLFHPG